MRDSTDLLKAEIAKEEALLADEKQSLQEMDKNAKRAEAERKRLSKNVCRLKSWNMVVCFADMLLFKEHPVLRQLDELPQDSTASEFTLLNTKSSQTTFDEVCLSYCWTFSVLGQSLT